MFVFENLLELEDRAIQLLLKEVESETLIISLKGAPPRCGRSSSRTCRSAPPNCSPKISTRAARCGVSEVETQQRRILQIVRNLAESGQIQLGGKAEDAYV
jgi:flagellar motor switch protein FliG